MKRTIWTTVMAVAVAALVTIPLVAQQPQGRGFGRGMGMGMGPGGPGGRGGPGGPMALLRGVELTDAQREQIRGIMDAHRQDAPAQRMHGLQQQLQLAILADAPDAAKIQELKGAIAGANDEALASRIEMETKIAQILTPAQRAKAREAAGTMRGR
jgi:periplasmic protein CpxP/Spy